MNATKNATTETERISALYDKLTDTETKVAVLEKLLSEAKNEAQSLYAEIEKEESRNVKEFMEEQVAKNDIAFADHKTAKSTAKKTKKSKRQNKKAAEIATTETEIPTETETTTETNTETEKPLKKLPVFDRPNHLIAYKYLDENGKEIRREPVTETKKSTASKKKAKK